MPTTKVLVFADVDGTTPVLDWLKDVLRRERRVYAKCVAKIVRLEQLGYELRRPEADLLRDGIHELRIAFGHVNYRILYFFAADGSAVLVHSLVKEDRVLGKDIDLSLTRKSLFERNPERHTYNGEH